MNNDSERTDSEEVTTASTQSSWRTGPQSATDHDQLFEVLADGYRRHILGYLATDADDTATFSELLDHVAGSRGVSTEENRERIAVNLHHAHLPKLVDTGLVEYDPRSETVRYRGGPAVTEWVDFALEREADRIES